MELRHLESFLVVAEEGSLSAASRRRHQSQPSLSQQMAALEEELGEALFVRHPRGMSLTAAGATLAEHARVLLSESERLKAAFSGRRELREGSFSFGIIPTIAPYLLPSLLRPFREAHPGVNVSVREARTEDLISAVVSGEVEFAILSDVRREDRRKWSLSVKELFREPLLLAAPRQHPLAAREAPPEPADLDPRELIHLGGGHCLADRTLRLCRIRDPNPGLRCDQLATALSMVAAGMGVTVVPRLATRTGVPDNVVVRAFGGDDLYRVITLMRRRGERMSPAAERFLGKGVEVAS